MFTKDTPDAVAENTISKRSSGATGMDNPVVRPLLIVPSESIPVSGGANVTTAPGIGLKMLFGVDDLYNCAVIVTVDPIRVSAAVVLK